MIDSESDEFESDESTGARERAGSPLILTLVGMMTLAFSVNAISHLSRDDQAIASVLVLCSVTGLAVLMQRIQLRRLRRETRLADGATQRVIATVAGTLGLIMAIALDPSADPVWSLAFWAIGSGALFGMSLAGFMYLREVSRRG